MSRYELVARSEIPEEDDSSYTVRIAQDRLKRKKYKRILIAFVCVVIFFFLVAGIASGVVMGVTTAGNKGDYTKTNAPNKNVVSVSTAVISSSPHSVSQTTSMKVVTPRLSATKDNSKTFTTTHSHSHRASSPTIVSTSVTSASPQATTTKKIALSSHTPSFTREITTESQTTTPSQHTNSLTSSTVVSTGVSSVSPRATTTKKTLIKSEVSSHTPPPTRTLSRRINVTDHTSWGNTPTAAIKTFSTNHFTKSAAVVATVMTTTTSPKHTSATESTTGHYSVATSSTTNQIYITTSQHKSVTVQTTTSVSPSPTVIPVNTFNSQILNYIDTSYDPCENFYEYSCGQWYDHFPDASEWGTSQDLALDNYNRIGKYLSHYVDDYRDPDAIKKAKYIYSACINSDYISRHLVTELKSFMIYKAGGWENGDFSPYNSWSINNNLYQDHYLGSSAFFTFGVEPDDLDSTKQVIRVGNIVRHYVTMISWSS